MKKSFIVLAVAIASIFKATDSNAEEMKAGGGLAYQNDNSLLGLEIRGLYYFNEDWAVQPGFTYYFAGVDDGFTFIDFGLNLRYDIVARKKYKVYAESGYLLYNASQDNPTPNFDQSFSTHNLNIGAGGEFPLNDVLSIYTSINVPLDLEELDFRTFLRAGVYYGL